MYQSNNRWGGAPRYNNHFSRNRFSSRRGRNQQSNTIPVSMFVKKANTEIKEVAFIPKMKFQDLQIEEALKNNILRRGYTTPTPIQDGAIQYILDGKDVVGIANTGTGKTAAFLIPLLNKIMRNNSEKALIVVPTRELAQQIRDEFRMLTPGIRVFASLCIGGASLRMQMFELRRNPHIVIGTPGRLKDLIDRKILNLSNFKTIILDEVDRMVDMGFIHDIKYLVSLLPEERQSLFFSATLPTNVVQIMHSFLKNPITVKVKSAETSANVDQDIIRVQNGEMKIDILQNLLKKEEFKKVLIFGRTKMGVERLSTALYQKGFKVASIHGDKPQFKRQQAIRYFKDNVVNILVATDVVARGIDIPNITHVINYDQPSSYEDYVHRIGRTGRANQKGIALTFV